jgi:hypothetical protein
MIESKYMNIINDAVKFCMLFLFKAKLIFLKNVCFHFVNLYSHLYFLYFLLRIYVLYENKPIAFLFNFFYEINRRFLFTF